MLRSTLLVLFGFVSFISLYEIKGHRRDEVLFVQKGTQVLLSTNVDVLGPTQFLFWKLKPSGDSIFYFYVHSVNCTDVRREVKARYITDIVKGSVNGRIYLYCSKENVSVIIEHPTSADNGLYCLKYKEGLSSEVQLKYWRVFVMHIKMTNKWLVFAEGSSAHFYGNPDVSSNENRDFNLSVTWVIDGYTRYQTDRFHADDHMWIPRVTRDLDGKSVIYRVQYEDVVGEVYYNLSVIYIEKDTEHEFVEEGSSISFHVNGIATKSNEREAMTYNWMLDGRFIHENYMDRMWLPYLTRDLNRKNLTCVIRNENSLVAKLNYILQVSYGPSWPVKLIPPNTAYYLAPGDSVPKIRCEVDCNPSCSINWGDFGDGDTLTLGHVSKSDTGEYICTAARNGSDRVVYRSVYVQVSDESFTTLAFLLLGIPIALNTISTVIIAICLWRFYKIRSDKASKARDTLNINSSNIPAAESKEHQTVPVPANMYEDLQRGARGFQDETAYYSLLENAPKAGEALNINSSNLPTAESKEHQTVPVPTEMYEDLQKGAQGFDKSATYSSLKHENSGYTDTSAKVSVK